MESKILLPINLLVLFLLLIFIPMGCKSSDKSEVHPLEHRFERTSDRVIGSPGLGDLIFVQFDGVPFGQAMGILSRESGIPIVWSEKLDLHLVYGRFPGYSVSSILEVLSRRSDVNVAQIGGVFYVGDIQRQDRAIAILRLPSVDRRELESALRLGVSTDGSVSIVGSLIWISDTMESLRKLSSAIELIRERSERSYIAELYFIRVNEDAFVDLTAELQIRQIDIFASGFNINELFRMFLDVGGSVNWSQVSQRPVLYLSEGRRVTFTDGREITREKRVLTESGALETTGYQTFSDGLQLTMLLNRVSDMSYAVDIDLSVSVFDKNDRSTIPASDKSSFVADGLRVEDSQVYYIGSLSREHDGRRTILSYRVTRSCRSFLR
jgi:hypothetical protein